MALAIFEEVFESGDDDDDKEREPNERLAFGDGNARLGFEIADDEEVDVGHFGELLHEIERQEGPEGVFARANEIIRKLVIWATAYDFPI